MLRPRLLDLFCCAGGAARGYQRAGFHVTGVDWRPMPRYAGDVFVQGDALEYLAQHGQEYDAIHASPPCQVYSSTRHMLNVRKDHADLVPATREALDAAGRPWVLENVPLAPLSRYSITLCGLSFGLRVFRHRRFEASFLLLAPPHPAHGDRRIGVGGFCSVAGNGGSFSSGWRERRRHVPADHRNKAAWSAAMAIDWMTRDELAQAIPPAYTEFVGRQLMNAIA